jgi:hypothetical protein
MIRYLYQKNMIKKLNEKILDSQNLQKDLIKKLNEKILDSQNSRTTMIMTCHTCYNISLDIKKILIDIHCLKVNQETIQFKELNNKLDELKQANFKLLETLEIQERKLGVRRHPSDISYMV